MNEIRKSIANKYKESSERISHKINQGIVRQFTDPILQSLYLDVIYRGNFKLNFGHRMTDKDLILLTDCL